MNSNEYHEEIARLAEWISDNRPAELGGKGIASEYGEDYDAGDALHETLDGHGWVIYTYQARQVIAHSDNPDFMMDEFGTDAGGDMFDARRAYWAMYADIMEQAEDDKYDLDELRAERFEEMIQGEDFAQWVKETIQTTPTVVPTWSAATITEYEWFPTDEGEIELTLHWMPNSTTRLVTITDNDGNEAKITA